MLPYCVCCSFLGDDAALVLPPSPPAYLVHSIDYFRSFINDPYVMGQIAVNHALSGIVPGLSLSLSSLFLFSIWSSVCYLYNALMIWLLCTDVYAMNAEAVSAMALCVLPYGPERMVSTAALIVIVALQYI